MIAPPAVALLGEFTAVLALVVREPLLNLVPWPLKARMEPLPLDSCEFVERIPEVAVDCFRNFYFRLLSMALVPCAPPMCMKLF